jgi:S-adenosylmethionine synthetase
VLEIGYDSSEKGFDGNSCGVSISIGQQSQDIAQGVNDAFESRVSSSADPLDLQGAGDQGLMFGYACKDTPELMPIPIALAHKLAQQLTKVRKDGTLPYLRPDGKTQVTIEYQGDKAIALNTIVISSQHAADIDLEKKLAPEIKKLSVDRWEMPVLLAAKLSLIPMVAWPVMVVVRSPVKIHQRLIAQQHMQCVGWQRMLLQQSWLIGVRCRLPMQLVKHNQ